MKIYFTSHALQRMKERNIKKQEVYDSLKYPDKIAHKENTIVVMKLRKNNHLLIIIYNNLGSAKKIITIIDTSKVKKYL